MQTLSVKNDIKLDLDPYFYVRKKELQKIREDIKSANMEILSEEQYEQKIKQIFNTLKNKSSEV